MLATVGFAGAETSDPLESAITVIRKRDACCTIPRATRRWRNEHDPNKRMVFHRLFDGACRVGDKLKHKGEMSMGVYIKGMEMPKDDHVRVLVLRSDGRIIDEWGNTYQTMLIPPHGDLIDRDELERDIERYVGGEESRSRFHHWVQVQNAVILGDKGEET